ncbi:putative reverse transcriptase domain-containing protein, partial [Tanacetum coccineum]
MPTSGQGLSVATIEQLITQRVAEAMAAYETNQNNQNGNPNVNVGGVVPFSRECTYQDFVKCQPLNFKGIKGVVGLTKWFEKMDLIQKMETELWNLSMKGNDLTTYTQRFQELILLCTKMVPEEEDRVEKLQDAIRIANHLMDQKLKGYIARNVENKRRVDNNLRDNRMQQPPFKRQNVARAYTVGNNKNKGYARILTLYDKCKLHYHGPCPVRCGNCKKVGHQARDCWASTTMTCYGYGGKGHTK